MVSASFNIRGYIDSFELEVKGRSEVGNRLSLVGQALLSGNRRRAAGNGKSEQGSGFVYSRVK